MRYYFYSYVILDKK